VSALAEPARRALYGFVSRSEDPVSRDAAAEASDLSRSTAAFHLDRLAASGLLEVEYRRLSGKAGPGAGRPAKLYRRARDEVVVSLPARHYDLAADLLAQGIERSIETGQPVRSALRDVAAEAGHELGASVTSLPQALEDNGFEPHNEGNDIVLGNCPFHRLAQKHTEIVCELNHELIRGIGDGAGDVSHVVSSDPGAGHCCVRVGRVMNPS
jgi:predicted ArsR family transcriptional regulator